MRRTGFDYRVMATVSITGAELGRLMTLSRLHYDGKCRAARESGGLLYGLCNQWAMHNDKQVSPAFLDEALQDKAPNQSCGADLLLPVEVLLTFAELDLLAKIGEGEQFYCRGGDKSPTSMMLTMQFRGVMHECNAEYTRINPSPPAATVGQERQS